MKFRFAAFLALIWLVPSAALAQIGESIDVFHVDARLDAHRRLTVTESIRYDFGEHERHGIYRDIPVRYERNGGNYNLRLSVDEVTMDGDAVPYDTSREGDDLRLKIGDPDETINGLHTYVITYHTDRAINFFDGEGELYWNVTGNGWPVPIASAAVTLTGPEGFDAAKAQTACYTGVFGSTERACATSGVGNQTTVQTTASLAEGEGLTFVVRFPKGLITEPTLADKIWGFIADNGVLSLPFFTLGFMLWLWNRKGRDPKGRGTIIPQYEAPRGLSPAELSSLKEQDVPMRTVTATILDLARRGFLKIDFGEEKGFLRKSTTYTFIKVKEADGLSAADAGIFNGLFEKGESVELSELKGSFYKRITPFKNAIFRSLKTKGFFEASPITVRSTYIGIAIAVGVVSIWLLGAFLNGLAIVSLVVSAVIIAIVGWFMPRTTPEGAVALEEVEGFKWFLSVTEKDRLAFHNAPAVKPAMFHEFLPAAIAFGVEEKWAEQFKGLDIPPPSYATGSVLNHWVAMNFVHDLGRMNEAAASSAYAAPSSAGSGGSGFSGGGSGGGFGGGGGGSW